MTPKDEIKALFVDDTLARKKAIRDFIMDKTQPYEDRLEVWMFTPGHLEHHEGHLISLSDYEAKYGRISWGQDFNVHRYEKVYLEDLVNYDVLYDKPEKIRAFYENCLDLGVHSFTYDW